MEGVTSVIDRVEGWLTAALTARGMYDTRLPSSYADGVHTPEKLPVVLAPEASLLADLDHPALDADLSAAPPPADDLFAEMESRALTMENVEALLEEMVRPALNADGGDITLLRIEDGNIYVKLVGSCQSCPSSVMTMRMGVERLLQEEFPQMNELIQEDAMF